MNPRVLFVGSTRYSLPLPPGLERKFSALERVLDYRVIARGTGDHPRFRLFPSGAGFYGRLPRELRRQLVSFRPQVIVAEDPRTAAIALSAPARQRAAAARDRRGARQLAARDAALRLAGAPGALAPRRRARPLRRTPCRRHAGALRLHGRARAEGSTREAAGSRLPDLQRPVGVHGPPVGAAAGQAGRGFRRRARGVQERRGPRCRVAAGGAAGARGEPCRRRQGPAGSRRRASRPPSFRVGSYTWSRFRPRGSRNGWTRPRCSCCRRASRVSGGS